MKALTSSLLTVAMLGLASPVALAAPAKPAPKPAAKPAPAKPSYHKLEEEKWLGFGTGKYTLQGTPVMLTQKPWWYGWTPDTTWNTGLTSDGFKAILVKSPEALASASGRDGLRTIGMISNIAPRAVTLAAIIPLVTMVKDLKTTYTVGLGLIGLIVAGIAVDWGTEVLTWNSLGHTVDLYNQGSIEGASLPTPADPLAELRPPSNAQITVGLASLKF